MPTSQAPAEVNETSGPAEPSSPTDSPTADLYPPEPPSPRKSGPILGLGLDLYSSPIQDSSPSSSPEPSPNQGPEPDQPRSSAVPSSRWSGYNTHELLEIITEFEDERRWGRLREAMLWAILVHILMLFALFFLPRFIKIPSVIDSSRNLRNHKDFTYLDTPFLPKPRPAAPMPKHPLIDKQTLEQMKKLAAPSPPPAETQPAPSAVQPQPSQPIPPNPQSQVEAPRPSAVPARPNFVMGSQNPADQLREAMRNSRPGNGQPNFGDRGSGGLAMHPGAGTGGIDVLSDTQGVNFNSWLARWHYITQMTWDPLIPDEVNPPILKKGVVAVRFKVLPNGQVADMQLEGRSGDTGLDRAAWGAITGSSYPPLPREFHGPYLELRAWFLYNIEPQ